MKLGTLALGATLLAASGLTASAASIDKSIDVKAPAAKIWEMIGPFCSIKDWHPAIGECTEKDGVRMLTTQRRQDALRRKADRQRRRRR